MDALASRSVRPIANPGSALRYRAFLSYSHRDRVWAEWLHVALETYRLPKQLVGRRTKVGGVPARLTPIFRDREELAVSNDLGETIRTALSNSFSLIVLCSPAAASSSWTNEEIATFKRLNPAGGIFAAIICGEPYASEMPGREEEECFPFALRYRLDGSGQSTGERAEPIAADFRDGGDGKRLALLKLVAGMTGVGVDELAQRDAHRRHHRLAILAAASLAGMGMASGLAIFAVQARSEAEQQRGEAEHLIEYMLTDLRSKLEPVGRLEALDGVGMRALSYYDRQDIGDLDPASLSKRARALHLIGEVRELRGDTASALTAFRQAAASTAELLLREPNDTERIYDHAQSVFWVSYIARQRGILTEAKRGFEEYRRLSAQLVARYPGNRDWQAELGYAATALGVLALDDDHPQEALPHFEEAERIWTLLGGENPGNRTQSYDLAQSFGWKADALKALLRHDEALELRHREAALYQRLLGVDATNTDAKAGLAVAMMRVGQLELCRGESSSALDFAARSSRLAEELRRLDPANRLWQEISVKAANGHAEALLYSGNWSAAAQVNRSALRLSADLVAADPTIKEWRADGLVPARAVEIAIAARMGPGDAVDRLVRKFRSDFRLDPHSRSGDERLAWIIVELVAARNWRMRGNPTRAEAAVQRARALLMGPERLHDARQIAAIRYLEPERDVPESHYEFERLI